MRYETSYVDRVNSVHKFFAATLILLFAAAIIGLTAWISPSLTGAFVAGGSEWENRTDIMVDNTVLTIGQNITFGENKPVNCADGIYIETNNGRPVAFNITNEIYIDTLCAEAQITFDNIIYGVEQKQENIPITAFAAAENGNETNIAETYNITYFIYFGKIVQQEANITNETLPEPPRENVSVPEIANKTFENIALPENITNIIFENVSIPAEAIDISGAIIFDQQTYSVPPGVEFEAKVKVRNPLNKSITLILAPGFDTRLDLKDVSENAGAQVGNELSALSEGAGAGKKQLDASLDIKALKEYQQLDDKLKLPEEKMGLLSALGKPELTFITPAWNETFAANEEKEFTIKFKMPDSPESGEIFFYALGENLSLAVDPWWDSSWFYKKNLTVTNSLTTALTNFQVNLTVDTTSLISSGKMNSSCYDIRFVNSSNSSIDYWIENGTCNSATTAIWIEVPNIPASGTETISMYYGNPAASIGSNGDNTFIFFDNFEDPPTAINTTKWTVAVFGGSATVVSGTLNQYGLNNAHRISSSLLPRNITIEERIKVKYVGVDRDRLNVPGTGIDYGLFATGVNDLQVYFNAWSLSYPPSIAWFRMREKVNDTAMVLSVYNASWSYTNSINYAVPASFSYNQSVGDGAGSNSGNITTDWIFVRKWAATEPTASFATEESSATLAGSANPASVSLGGKSLISAKYADTNGNNITYATCLLNVSLPGGDIDGQYTMTYDSGSGNYTYNYSTRRLGTNTASVTCSKGGYPTLTSNITITVTGTWWDTKWTYKKNITVTNNVAAALTNYQVNLTVDTATLISAGKLQSNCNDLRFANSSGTQFDYWIEDGTCNTANTNIWIEVTDLPASGNHNISMYYGNSNAAADSNVTDTFLFSDDFNSVTLDANKWTTGNCVLENNGPYAFQVAVGYNTPTADGQNLSFTGTRSGVSSAVEDGALSGWWGRSVIGKQNITETNFTVEAEYWFTQSSGGCAEWPNEYTEFHLGVGYNKDNYDYGEQYSGNTMSHYREVSGTLTTSSTAAHNAATTTWKRVLFKFINTTASTVDYSIDGTNVSYTAGALSSRNISIGFSHRANSLGGPGCAAVTQKVDWVIVHKYAKTEPSVALGSEEEPQGSTIESLSGTNFVLESNTSVDVTQVGQSGLKTVLVKYSPDSVYTGRLSINFPAAGTVDLSGMIMNDSLSSRKSVLYRSSWPYEVARKDLLIPGFGTAEVYVCPSAQDPLLSDVSSSCSGVYKLNLTTRTAQGSTLFTKIYDSRFYVVVQNVTGTGGGETSTIINRTSDYAVNRTGSDVLASTNVSDNVYAILSIDDASTYDWVDLNWTNNINKNATINNVSFYFEHLESTTTNVQLLIQWLDSGAYKTLGQCSGNERLVKGTNNCELTANISTVSKANNISLRYYFNRTGALLATRVSRLDFDYMLINFTYHPLSVTLNRPTNNNHTVDLQSAIVFNCSAEDDAGLASVELYHNLNGTFKANGTNTVTGTSNQTIFSRNLADFIGAYTIKDSQFIWNCRACNSEGSCTFAPANYTFSGWNLGTYNQTGFNLTNSSLHLPSNDTYLELPNYMGTDGFIDMSSNILLYHLNELSGDVGDYSGNNNNATRKGASQGADGKLYAGYNFGGALGAQCLNTTEPPASSTNINTGSVFAWMKTDVNNAGYVGLVIKWYAYGMFLNDNVFGVYDWGNSAWRSTNATLNDGVWHFVGFTFQNGTSGGTKVYVDGVERLSTTIAFSNQLHGISVGAGDNPCTQQYYNGNLDEISVFNRALTPAEVMSIYNRQRANYTNAGRYDSKIFDASSGKAWKNITWTKGGLYNEELPNNGGSDSWANMTGNVLLYHMNEQSGTIVDYSGAGNNGTVNGATYGATGKIKTALRFDYYTDDVSAVNSASLDITKNLTIEAWVNLNTTESLVYPRIVSKLTGAVPYKGYELLVGSRDDINVQNKPYLQLFDSTGTQRYLVSDEPIATNTWYHIAGTYDTSGNAYIYVNGVLRNSTSGWGASAISSNTANLTIGRWLDNGFNGTIDEVAVYNRSLSASEISDHFKRGALRLNLTVRSCSSSTCSGTNFTGSYENSTFADISNLSFNRYFQYRANFVSDNGYFTPLLPADSVTIGYAPPTSNLTSCQDLTGQDSVYTITQDVTGNMSDSICMHVLANNVTLDCDGHKITGNNRVTYGVYSYYYNLSQIKNCVVMNYSIGLYFFSGYNSTFTNDTVCGNDEWDFASDTSTNNFANNMTFNNTVTNFAYGGAIFAKCVGSRPANPTNYVNISRYVDISATKGFATGFGNGTKDALRSVQQTSDGGYITAGYINQPINTLDVCLIKTDSVGTHTWNKTFGSSDNDYGYSVQQTNDSGYIVTGSFQRATGDYDIYLIKTNSSGNNQWNKTFGEAAKNDEGYSVWQTNDSGYIITGYTYSYGGGGSDVWLLKTNSSGDLQWNKTYGGTGTDVGRAVQQTSDGGYIIIGYTNSTTAAVNYSMWLIKTNSTGGHTWNKTFGDADDSSFAYSGQQTSDGGYILTGLQTGGAGASFSTSVPIIKTNSSGDQIWRTNYSVSSIASSTGQAIHQTSDGGYILLFDSTIGSVFSYVRLAKIDTSGNVVWDNGIEFDALGAQYVYGYSVDQTSDGGYIVAGYNWWNNFTRLVKANPFGVVSTVDPWIYLNVSYSDSDVTAAGILNESTLFMAKYSAGNWTTNTSAFANPYGVNTTANYVYANISNFASVFAPMGTKENSAPTQNNPILNATDNPLNRTTANLTCYPQNLSDADSDAVWPTFNWYVNGTPYAVLNLPFNTNVSTTGTGAVLDYSGYRNNATRVNNVNWVSSGKLGGAYDFVGGANDYLSIVNSPSLNLTGNLTISAWIKTDATGLQLIISKRDSVQGDYGTPYQMYLSAQNKLVLSIGGGGTQANTVTGTIAMATGTWYHVVGTISGTNMSVYVNGTIESSATYAGTRQNPQVDILIGVYNKDGAPDGFPFNGVMDEIKMFNRSLSPDEIRQLYVEGLNVLNTSTIVASETTKNEFWMCSVTPSDGIADGLTKNSTNLTIKNTPPGTPVPNYPGNSSVIVDLTPRLNWTVPSDDDLDSLHFELQIANDSAFAELVVNANSSASTTGFTPTPPVAQNSGNASYEVQSNLEFRQFFWRVRAYDGTDYGNWSTTFIFNTTSSVSCELSNSTIDFGSINPGSPVNATLNFAGTSNGTLYNITSSSNVNVNVTHKGTNLTSGTNKINITYVGWKSALTATDGNMVYGNKIALQEAYDTANKVATALGPNNATHLRYWLDTVNSQAPGTYTGNYTILCEAAT